jgi:hypothetical protein
LFYRPVYAGANWVVKPTSLVFSGLAHKYATRNQGGNLRKMLDLKTCFPGSFLRADFFGLYLQGPLDDF